MIALSFSLKSRVNETGEENWKIELV